MRSSSFFGYKCPKCGSTCDIIAMVGGEVPLCSVCKTEMVPDPDGKKSAANVTCKKCNSSYGLINSDRCPECGTPF